MTSLKKGEGVSLLHFEGGPGVPFLNFEGGPGVPLLIFRGVPGPTFKLRGSPVSWVPGSRGPGPTFTPCPLSLCNTKVNLNYCVGVKEKRPKISCRNHG